MKLGSLFSGAAGLDMAVEQSFDAFPAWHCEVDPAAAHVLSHRYPTVPNLGDVTQVDWEAVEPVDVMCGGYPCQPFSSAGQRKGTHDERHLWPYFADAIRRVRPRYVVLENVAGHRSLGFGSVLGDLAALGFDSQWTSIKASEVGAPHRRERLFVLASNPSNGRRTEGQPESETFVGRLDASPRSHSATPLFPTPKAADGAWGRPRTSDRPIDKSTHLGTIVTLLPTPNASDGSGGGQDPLRRQGHSRQLIDYVLVDTQRWGKYAPAIRRWENATRLAPAPTETNAKGNPRLSAQFSEWLMGWPPGWVTDVPGISRNDQLRIIGNGVVPQQAVAALSWLLSLEVAA